jgi:hypothetical protein
MKNESPQPSTPKRVSLDAVAMAVARSKAAIARSHALLSALENDASNHHAWISVASGSSRSA